MTDTLDASVSKLLVVGGRAVSASPPGALVEPPPRRAARGREADTLFVLIVPAPGGEQAQAAFYEDLAHRAAESFFAASGSVTSAIREMVGKLDAALHSGADTGRYPIGLACLVLRGADCYIARVGSVLSLIRQDGVLRIDPEPASDGASLSGTALGGESTHGAPDIKFAHYTVAPDQVVVLADSGLAAAHADLLDAALGASDLPAVVSALKPLAASKAQALIIRFAASSAPANLNGLPVLRPKVESLPSRPSIQNPTGSGSSSSGNNPLATVTAAAPVAPVLTAEVVESVILAPAPITNESPAAPVNRPSVLTVTDSPPPIIVAPVAIAIPVAPNVAEMPAPDRGEAIPVLPLTSALPDAPINPPTDGTPAALASSAPQIAVRNLAVRLIRLPFTTVLAVLRGINRIIALILDRLLPESADGRTPIPIMTAVSIAILIPVLVVFVTVGLKFSQIDQTNFEKLVGQLQDQAAQAQAVPPGNPTLVKRLWQTVLLNVADAEQQRPGDPALEQIRAQAVNVLDQYEHVTRKAVVPVRVFGSRAVLGAVLVQGGADVYTLDTTDEAIYRDTLRSPGVLQTHSTDPITQSGTALSGYSVKSLAAMIWMEEGGIRTSHALVALDPQGFLVTYSPILATALAQPLLGSEQWKAPVAMQAWQGRLYILDPKANQIWRYVAVGTTYPNAPEEYFTSDYQRNLAQAVDFAIDEKGNVYILYADGALKEYTGGVEQIFTPSNLPDGKLQSGGALYLDTSTPLPALYVTDPADGSIYEFTLAGTFQARFKPLDPRAFDHISGLFVQGSSVYVTAGTTLYYFSTQS